MHDQEQAHDTLVTLDEAHLPRRLSISQPGGLNHARKRPQHLPRHDSGSFPAWKAKQECALKIGIGTFEHEFRDATGIAHLELHGPLLTVLVDSQSKLSHQELVDLQKHTHFEKKELQQWYKGESAEATICHVKAHADTGQRLFKGLPEWHAQKA